MQFLDIIARAIFPHFCVGCGTEGTVLCAPCRAAHFDISTPPLRFCPSCDEPTDGGLCGSALCAARSALDGATSFLPYALPVPRKLLQLYKYERVDEAGATAAGIFGAFAKHHLPTQTHIILPVPMHPFRERLRGFNQADTFAVAAVQATGARITRKILHKRFRLKRQAEMHAAADRAKNAQGSITVARSFEKGLRFLLIDDVFTTGATLQSCAKVLKKAGAAEVRSLTLLKG